MSISCVGGAMVPVAFGGTTTGVFSQPGAWTTGDTVVALIAGEGGETITCPSGTVYATINGLNLWAHTIASGDGTSFTFTTATNDTAVDFAYVVYRSTFGACSVDQVATTPNTLLTPTVGATFGADWLLLIGALDVVNVSGLAFNAPGGTVSRLFAQYSNGIFDDIIFADLNAPVGTAGSQAQRLFGSSFTGSTAPIPQMAAAITLQEGTSNSIVMIL